MDVRRPIEAERDRDEREQVAADQRVWDRLSRWYDAIAVGAKRLRPRVARVVELGPGARVLDVATGTGAQALAFARRGARVVGVDLSAAMLAVARRKRGARGVSWGRADAVALPFADASFDVVSISFALHEMPPGIRERALGELARVTRRGGAFVVVDLRLPSGPVARWIVFHVVKRIERDAYVDFVRRDLVRWIERAGIEVVDDRPTLFGLARIVVGRRT